MLCITKLNDHINNDIIRNFMFGGHLENNPSGPPRKKRRAHCSSRIAANPIVLEVASKVGKYGKLSVKPTAI
jgi:hypothetical protein